MQFVFCSHTIWFTALPGVNAGFRYPFYLDIFPAFTYVVLSQNPVIHISGKTGDHLGINPRFPQFSASSLPPRMGEGILG